MDDIGAVLVALEKVLEDAGNIGTPELFDSVVSAAEELKGRVSDEDWSTLCNKIRDSFNLTDEQLAERLGVKAISVPREPENVPFEGLVEGGWFKRYLEYTSQSEAPAQFHFGAVMVAAAASLMRRPAIQWGTLPTYPNLYALLIGPTCSRKSTSMAIAADIVKRAVPGMNVLPAEGTHQGYSLSIGAAHR